MKTKNTRENEVYKKVGRRYIPMGYMWEGFPADGIWLVQNGRQNMVCLIGLKEDVPIHAMAYRKYEQELCKYLMEKCDHISWMDVARLCCDFFARKVDTKTTA